ncbi:MAG: glycoside hydrolase family 127 protein [Prevotella sp.]|nr:glycoside hydrolase family 127 protein [Prevotella sp.]
MKKLTTILLCMAVAVSAMAKKETNTRSNGYPIAQVPFTAVKITPETFWGDRIRAAREVTIPLAFSKCESAHRYENFNMAAYTLQHPGHEGLETPKWNVAKFMGFSFDDTDVYKTIEGASYVLQTYPDQKLKAYIDSVLDIVGAAQEPDGYLYTARTINPKHPHSWSGKKRWEVEEILSHELYNLGHMVDAACAHYQATGSDKFLNIAKRYADCVVREVGPNAGQACVVPGHQIAEMALARLYVLTGEQKYLDEAKFLLDYRGKTGRKDIYSQSNKPVVDQTEAWGHAVRAGYMYAGMADVAALTGDSAYIKAIDTIYDNIVSRKYYITGGVGARHAGEAFGADYELPNLTSYNETCAAISMVYLFHRMFLLHGDAKYIDCMERTLYNGVISGMSVDGGRFFYPNPLSSDGKYAFNADNTVERQPWFGCACCPSNLCRFIPSFPGYMYAVKDRSLYVNLFAGNTATVKVGGKDVQLEQTTNYPWDGDIALKILKNQAKSFTLKIRIPEWATGKPLPSDLYSYAGTYAANGTAGAPYPSASSTPSAASASAPSAASTSSAPSVTCFVNGNSVAVNPSSDGYLTIESAWKKGDVIRLHFDMPVRTVKANDKVVDDRGRIAVERGPLVYCAEGADNQAFSIFNFLMPRQPQFTVADRQIQAKSAMTFSVKSIEVGGQAVEQNAKGEATVRPVRLTMIPYYAWNHRGPGLMEVWMPQTVSALGNY